ncbi:hypothetical protein CC85DRAFT_48640 [Cutaneotrichosporon oleaginosum]|uniref:Uncharacterized protein n=1 Tax=Cutaneotrichosporon oleaginosum TaxID=879819 RepID=A0A0J1B716_9TREE|nr:uncharacterized protein CC85DRAFT_48640 [Cutaneotrichosporon oleaginosum]KLT43514.1 hypothetical protein CC85DRAFT_48640 [Cutaneotrichosporon oleaginosum]TXT05587.1 hypothetical protein COLE_06907 [Cutaneotrichosporon oleaginosum]
MKLLPIMVAGVSFLPLRRAEHAVVAEDIASLLGITEEVATDVLGRGVIHRVIASGCHAKTVRHIHSTAAASDQFGLDESQITDLAISFTLCSMASALQKVPQECEPWDTTYTTHPGEDSAVRHPKEKERRRGRCLAVLHRSPQDWATFNTYFSDSTQLWLALTHQRHIELAQELYTNATQEKIALLQLLHRKAEASFATDAERDRRVEEQLTVSSAASKCSVAKACLSTNPSHSHNWSFRNWRTWSSASTLRKQNSTILWNPSRRVNASFGTKRHNT